MGKSLGADFTTTGGKASYERVQLSESEAQEYDPIALVAVAANNGAWLLSNGACDKNELEKALKLGMGLKKPLFTLVEEFGTKRVVQALETLANKYGEFYEPDIMLKRMASD